MKKIAIVRKHYALSGTEVSVRILRRIFTKRFIRKNLHTVFDHYLEDESILIFMTKKYPVINSQEMIDYVWSIADNEFKLAMLQTELTYVPSVEVLDRDWTTVPESSSVIKPKKIFQERTGYLPLEERLENKKW